MYLNIAAVACVLTAGLRRRRDGDGAAGDWRLAMTRRRRRRRDVELTVLMAGSQRR